MPDVATLEPLLERICASQPFRQSHRLQRFLRYITEWALTRPDEPLKEYAVAVAVYDKPASFDSQSDPIVRVEAGRLRSRLNEYYSGIGQKDDVFIELPKGSYIPLFKHRRIEPRVTLNDSIAVIPFQDDDDADLIYLANGLCEAVTRRLAQILKIRVAPWSMVLRAQDRHGDLEQRASDLGVHTLVTLRLVFHGDIYELHAELNTAGASQSCLALRTTSASISRDGWIPNRGSRARQIVLARSQAMVARTSFT